MPERYTSVLEPPGPPEPGEGLEGVLELSRPGVIWLGGEAVRVQLSGAERAAAKLTDRLVVGGRSRRSVLGAIDRWYRREARRRIGLCLEVESERLGLNAGKLTIRDQKTRWGSCSTSGTLSFNWRLVIGPHHALRYVVVHELIHIRHHNHSPAYWSELTEALPDWRDSAAWLRANERRLTRYTPRLG